VLLCTDYTAYIAIEKNARKQDINNYQKPKTKQKQAIQNKETKKRKTKVTM